MIEIGSRRRAQPAPPHVVSASLITPDADPARPWLRLLPDEQRPHVVETDLPGLVVWSSLWPAQPEALIRFELAPDGSGGTDLRWTLLADTEPDPSRLGPLPPPAQPADQRQPAPDLRAVARRDGELTR